MSNLYQEIVSLLEGGGKGVVATVISSQGSAPQRSQAKMLLREDGTSCGTVGGGRVEHKVREKAVEVLESGESQLVHFDLSGKDPAGSICGGQMDVFLEAVL
ncbi:MAG: XdhC family protein, partial [Dehalococcoidia bacterium]|nr:XdhC family protein [Dehalococcoidia bacterium]